MEGRDNRNTKGSTEIIKARRTNGPFDKFDSVSIGVNNIQRFPFFVFLENEVGGFLGKKNTYIYIFIRRTHLF